MRKIRFGYHEFEDAPKTTEESRRIESRGFLALSVICVCLVLGAIISFYKGSVLAGVLCIVAMMDLILLWMSIVQRTILPELARKAEAERIEFYAALQRANEADLDPQSRKKNSLRDELNRLLDQGELGKDEFRRIGELMEILEAMGEKFD